MFLSKEEVKRLTGTPQKKKQIEYLKKKGIPFLCDINGFPVAHKYHIDSLFKIKVKTEKEPDFEALND